MIMVHLLMDPSIGVTRGVEDAMGGYNLKVSLIMAFRYSI